MRIRVRQAGNGIPCKISCCVYKPAGATGNFMRHFHFQRAICVGCSSTGKACKKFVAVGSIKSSGAADSEWRWGSEVHGGQRYKTTPAEVAGLAGAGDS